MTKGDINWTNALKIKFLEIYLCYFNFQLLNCSLAHMKTKPSTLSQTERKLTNIIS